MPGSGLTILLADDSEAVRASFHAVLRTLGHTCIQACDGTDCVRLAQNPDLDLILVDLYMPRFDIYDFLEQVAKRPRKIPVAVISALDDDREMERLLQAGVLAYLVKPVEIHDLEQLMARIRKDEDVEMH